MEKHLGLSLLFLIFFSVLHGSHPVVAGRTMIWGYAAVRPGAHLFWWYHMSGLQLQDPSSSKWPIILWLQEGPGYSGAFGDFQQIGPMTVENVQRPYTWLWNADLLFVDSPVGTGFSYVDDDSLLVKTDEQAAHDLLFLLKDLLFDLRHAAIFKNRPLYIYGEGYGGKIAAYLGLLVNNAIVNGELALHPPVGVILADSWISPGDYGLALGPLLKDFSRISSNGLKKANRLATTIQNTLTARQYATAKTTWDDLRNVITQYSFNVDLHNIMLDGPSVGTTTIYGTKRIMRQADSRNYSTHVLPNDQTPFDFSAFMNGPIRKNLGTIIPPHVKWIEWNQKVFDAMNGDYMKPRIDEVVLLLAQGISVAIINGQYDVVCSTKGAEAWVEKLTGWRDLTTFLDIDREIMTFNDLGNVRTVAFKKAHKNLAFYWILNAGHHVAVDQPALLQSLVREIINSPPTVMSHG